MPRRGWREGRAGGDRGTPTATLPISIVPKPAAAATGRIRNRHRRQPRPDERLADPRPSRPANRAGAASATPKAAQPLQSGGSAARGSRRWVIRTARSAHFGWPSFAGRRPAADHPRASHDRPDPGIAHEGSAPVDVQRHGRHDLVLQHQPVHARRHPGRSRLQASATSLSTGRYSYSVQVGRLPVDQHDLHAERHGHRAERRLSRFGGAGRFRGWRRSPRPAAG